MRNSQRVIVRRIEWDCMHRIPRHEARCSAYHGHRYIADVAVHANVLDDTGRGGIDLGVMKNILGAWVDKHWDHTAILQRGDDSPAQQAIIEANALYGRPAYLMDGSPTVENLVDELARVADTLLGPHGIELAWIRLWETPNCSAMWTANGQMH